jgi:ABC-type lipoprotein release transport system permease subunit
MQTAEEELLSIFALQHLASRMTGVFGLVALALVTISLHSLVLSIVTARRKEIAIRTALGATGRNVLAWFGREIARPLGVGILFGMAGVWMAYRGMTAYIVGLAADDLSAVVAVITAACLLAAGTSLGAALWATREPPYSVLREN